jgi:hypothetical protein
VLLTTFSSIEEVGKVLAASKEIAVEEAEQFVSVTVVLSVTVTMETREGFFRVDVEVLEKDVWLIPEPVEEDKIATETPVTGAVKASRPEVALKRPAIVLLQRKGRWAGRFGASPWVAARAELCLSVHVVLDRMRPSVSTYRASCAAARRKCMTLMSMRGLVLDCWCIGVVKRKVGCE